MTKLKYLKALSVILSLVLFIAFVSGLGLMASSRAFSQVQKLEVFPEGDQAYFGFSIGLENDTALIGSLGDTEPMPDQISGAVYAFERINGQWIQQQKLRPSDSDNPNAFGWSLARDGDRALIGYGASGVYYFERVNGQWIEQQQLIASDYDPNSTAVNLYGHTLDIEGNLAVVTDFTNPADGEENDQRGAAYVYQLINGEWVEQQKLITQDQNTFNFGFDVTIENGVIIAGAYLTYNGSDVGSGAVYIFEQINGNWIQTQKIFGDYHDGFGISVNANDSLLVVGAIDTSTFETEAVYVFERINGMWVEQQALIPSDDSASDTGFGFDAAIQGKTIIVTRVGFPSDVGAVYIFTRQNGIWIEQQKLVPDDALPGDEFGPSVAIDDRTIMVGSGACNPDNPPPDGGCPGAVYVYTDPSLNPTQTPLPTFTSTPVPSTSIPTPTNTPLPDGTVELLVNGGFELDADENKEPDFWKLKQRSGDKLKCNEDGELIAFEGICAFQFKGRDGERSKLQQNLDLTAHSIAASDTLTLGGHVWSKGDVDSKVTLKVKYATLPTQKLVVDAISTNKQWIPFTSLQPGLSVTLADAPTEIILQIKNGTPSGKVRYDALSLVQQSNALIPLGVPQ